MIALPPWLRVGRRVRPRTASGRADTWEVAQIVWPNGQFPAADNVFATLRLGLKTRVAPLAELLDAWAPEQTEEQHNG